MVVGVMRRSTRFSGFGASVWHEMRLIWLSVT